ncbi:MAG: hypothetical protein J6Y58_01725 [Clostridiales bacterium]|nr:hypothetical protein [Clostridiales bacterium]
MKKRYIVAIVCILLAVAGMITYYCISTYGPGSDRAQIKKRVEFILESYGAINHNKGTWSSYSPDGSDLKMGASCKDLCLSLRNETYDNEDDARKALLVGVIFDIDEVEKREDKYVVTVKLTRKDKTDGFCYFVYYRQSAEWKLNSQCVEQAVYVGNGLGGSGSTLLDIMDILQDY